jgi:hypothetical protein
MALAAFAYSLPDALRNVSAFNGTGFVLSDTEKKSTAGAPQRARATDFVAKQHRLSNRSRVVAPKER